MSLPVGALPADPEPSSPPERPFAAAPASLPNHSVAGKRRRSLAAWVEGTLWAIAAASAVLVLLAAADRAIFSARETRLLDESTAAVERAREPGAAEASLALGADRERSVSPAAEVPFVAKLDIPSIALTALVVDGVDAKTLRRAVGRIPSSSLPGEAGDVALAGHRDSDFRSLGKLERGDPLFLRTAYGEFRYEVESIRIVTPQRVDVLTPADHPTLTLVTCYPFHYVGPAPLRYVVRAREVSRPSRATI